MTTANILLTILMLTNLKRTLSRTKKYKLWQEAYVYNLCSQAVKNYLTNHQLGGESIEVFLKVKSTNLEITLTCANSTILAWLKTNHEEIQEAIQTTLKQNDFSIQKEILLKFK